MICTGDFLILIPYFGSNASTRPPKGLVLKVKDTHESQIQRYYLWYITNRLMTRNHIPNGYKKLRKKFLHDIRNHLAVSLACHLLACNAHHLTHFLDR